MKDNTRPIMLKSYANFQITIGTRQKAAGGTLALCKFPTTGKSIHNLYNTTLRVTKTIRYSHRKVSQILSNSRSMQWMGNIRLFNEHRDVQNIKLIYYDLYSTKRNIHKCGKEGEHILEGFTLLCLFAHIGVQYIFSGLSIFDCHFGFL